MRPLFAVAGILAACGAGQMGSSSTMTPQGYVPPIPAGAQAETFRRIALQPDGASGLSISGIHAQRRQVIQDAATWAAAWHQIFAGQLPEPELAPVDFGKETVLLAAMGDCMNGGYSIAIDSVFAGADGSATAGVSSVTPDPMCMMMQMQVMTQPVDVVAVPRASSVAFAERGSMSMCGGMPMMGTGR